MGPLKNKLLIKTPTIEIKGDATFLSAEIAENNKSYNLFFSVKNEYAYALTYEVADCFLVAVLTHAMTEGLDVYSEAPISRHLLYSIKNRLVPDLSKHTKRYNSIEINAVPSDIIFADNKAVGMGWSGGADCFYTFTNMYNTAEPTHRLTHLVNINAGVSEGSEENIKREFFLNSENTRSIAEDFGLQSINIDTNIHLMYDEIYLSVVSQRLCSAVLALQKLFSKYYISSTCEVLELSFDEDNSAYYEYILCSSFKTQNLSFYDVGAEITRIEKLNCISDSPVAQKHLHVCIMNANANCLRCGKCVRTIAALYALGKLENFKESFDMDRVHNELDYILGDTYYHRKSKHYKEALDLMEKKGMKLSPAALRYADILTAAQKAAEKHKDVILKNVMKDH